MKKPLLTHIIVIAVLAAYMVFVRDCVFRAVIGIPCPFCGLTRANYALFNLDIKGAFSYHPLFIFIPLLLFFAFHYRLFKVKKKTADIIIITGAIIILVTYIIRMTAGAIV